MTTKWFIPSITFELKRNVKCTLTRNANTLIISMVVFIFDTIVAYSMQMTE